jgi:hypothetical protein
VRDANVHFLNIGQDYCCIPVEFAQINHDELTIDGEPTMNVIRLLVLAYEKVRQLVVSRNQSKVISIIANVAANDVITKTASAFHIASSAFFKSAKGMLSNRYFCAEYLIW